MFYDLETRQIHPLQATGNKFKGELLQVGRFSFYLEAFKQARMSLRRTFLRRPGWLIIDEIGPLELAGRGFEPVVGRIIPWYQTQPHTEKLLLVIRDHLLESVLENYAIRTWRHFSPSLDCTTIS